MNYVAMAMSVEFSIFWLVWLLAFCGVELYALHKEKTQPQKTYEGGTLSALIWRITRGNKLVMVIFTALWFVLTYHFFVWQP